jgi:cysteine-rich repeat protein
MRPNFRGRMRGNMLPLSGRLQRRHVAALALGALVLAGGIYRLTGPRLAQVSAPTACIRSYGPFFESVAGGGREESVSVFPDGTRFLKVTGPKTVSVFTVDASGVASKALDIQGDYQSAAVVAVSDTLAAIAYQDAGVAYYRLVRLNGVGGPTLESPIKLIDVPAGFSQYVRFALDAINGNQFVLVTNIPVADGPKTLSAIVAGNMTNGALRSMGSYASPPAESPEAIMDFDVAAIDIGNTNTVTFVVAFRGANGAKFIRASDSPSGVVFAENYLANIGQTAASLDLGSSFDRPRKAALTYKDNGSVYAGEIVLATATNDFDDAFSPTRINQNGDVVLGNGIDWIDEEFYVVAFGVQQSQNSPRKGTYIRRGVAGSSAFGSELKVTDVANPRSLTLAGIPGARGRILIAQTSATAADTGLIASYCAGCVGGVSDVGEACVTTSGTTTGGGGDAPLCDPRFCGNSEAEPGEQCDDGNTQFGDGCDALCRLECTNDGDCPSGECAGGTCTNLCGNGIVEPPVCVSQSGPMTCPPPVAGDMRIVNLPGGIFPLTHGNADFNKDGKLDVVVANYTGNTPPQADGHGIYAGTIEVFLNNGDGTFQARKEIGTFQWNDGGGDRGMDAFDADGDGDADVVVGDESTGGLVLLRNNNMVFTRVPFADGFHAFHLIHGDVNRDGDPDLGVDGFGEYDTVYSSVLLGKIGVTFEKTSVYTADGSYDTHEFADMDGDGDEDLIYIGGSVLDGQVVSHSIAVRLSNGDGTFADGTFMYAPGSALITEIDTGDFDDDGNEDVLLAEGNDNAVVIFGDGAGRARSVTEIDTPFGPRLLAVADPSADGIPDVVFGAGQGTEGRNLWYAKSNGDGTFAAPVRFVTLNPPASGRPRLSYNNSYYYNFDLRSGDYDGDGRLDLSVVHTLTSDSASVILMRSSLNNCTQTPPVITCSQAEECDDGALNGESGKCTQRCSFCGNGVIDTVNGVAEACDDGAKNGDADSACSLKCTAVTAPPRHLACVGIGMCAIVDGAGDDQCLDGATDCACLPSDPFCTHAACFEGSCVERPGPGMPLCTSNADCSVCPASDPNCHEKCDVLDMQCVGAPTGACPVKCEDDRHLACQNEQCVIKPGAGPNGCSTSVDCQDEPPKHLACVGIGACAVLDGAGDDQCLTGVDCECLPSDPTCTHAACSNGACIEVAGPGMPLCASNADCTVCPASNPNCHEKCDALDMQCVPSTSGSCPVKCEEDRHLACRNQQCASLPGAGPNTCGSQEDCVDDTPRHLACIGIGACAMVDGEGSDSCLSGGDCTCLPSDPTCTHAACVNGACAEVPGSGIPLCSSNADCAVCPASNPNCHQQCAAIQMQCVGAPLGSCNGTKCAEERHLTCQNEQCVAVAGAGPNTCGSEADCVDDTPRHLACIGIGACALVEGTGPDSCLDGGDCTCLPSDPSCTHAACFEGSCVERPGPGIPLCSSNADCTACPASNPNCHQQCAAIQMQCVAAPVGSCNSADCAQSRHLTCRNEQCVAVTGAGPNMCGSAQDCVDDTPRHLACIGIGACAMVDGAGPDSCLTGGNCTCLPSDPTCTHAACSNGACAQVPGPGIPLCSSNNDCTPCPASNPNCHQQCAAIQMQCVAAPLGACNAAECAEERHLTCRNEQCVSVPGAGPNTCSKQEDCVDDTPRHLACIGIGACAIVDGAGDDQCLDGATDCTCLPSDPFCAHAACVNGGCAEVAGPGMPLCASNADCTACPASNPNCHEKCDVLDMQCTSAPTGACPVKCEDDRHLACQNEQCVIKPGAGPNTCASTADCVDDTPRHLACIGIGACAIVDGEGPDACLTGGDCDCSASDPSCTHAACFEGSCVERPGPGIPLCSANADCTACPASNPDCHNQCAAILMQCEAAPLGSCNAADCAEPRHLVCQNEQCASVPGAGPNTCVSQGDCLVPKHLACTGVGACALVDGAGPDSCLTGGDCTCLPSDPTCTHAACLNGACAEVPGPGMPLCTANADCTPCPASDPNCHQQCAAIQMQCVGAPLGSCDAADCTEPRHLVCQNQQCASVPGAGPNECDSTADCTVTLCGNGTLDTGEDCDEGPNNRTGTPDDLSTWYCKAPLCTRSECFDGGDNDHDNLPDVLDAGCWLYDVKSTRANRPISFLGFLLAQTTPPLEELDPLEFLAGKDNESCPAETVDRGSFCALTCEAGDVCPGGEQCPEDGVCPVVCPNGAIDDNEDCDDGNLEDGDLCSNICHLNPCTGPNCPRCGDGVFQHQIGEQCDDGNQNDADDCTNNCRVRCDGNDDCQGLCDLATQQCLPPVCGDAETNQPWERCDDGNIVNDDQCNNQCQPTCKGDADCESGRCDQAKQVCVPLCGNGTVDSQEQCDDGNMVDNDQCSSQCLLHCSDDSTCDCDEDAGVCRPLCGNGRVDTGEGCDDGNDDNADACSNRCQVRCRPGTVCPDNQACPQNGLCPVPGECGDGMVNNASEQCDDGNKVDGDGCSNACKVRCEQNLECPSGLLCIGQECSECTNSLQCSDGFCVEGRCRQALPICGNGVVEPGEVCDDANGDDADGCTSSCLFPRDHACVASAQCQTKLCEGQVCTPCTSAGQCGSGLRCAEGNCLFGGEQCGDATVQAGEACDDANLNEQDQCTSACLLPFGRACTHATQCASTICSAGSCTPCRGDSECSGGLRCAIGLCLTDKQMSLIPNLCGNGLVEGGEACDDGNGAYGDGCTPSCQVGNSPSRSEVAANVSVQLPFSPMANVGEVAGGSLHAGASGGLSDTGPAAVAVMAAGAAAGTAWVRRKFGKKR